MSKTTTEPVMVTPEQADAIEDVLATMRYRISRLRPGDPLRDWLVGAVVVLTEPPEPSRDRPLSLVPPVESERQV